MVDDDFNVIAGSLAELLDPNIEKYSLMYGAIVKHNVGGYKGKIVKRPDDPMYDNVYDTAIESGALAGKLMGAGGGGTMAFLIELENYTQVKTTKHGLANY